ncbi:MAG: hypothetical protein A4S12_13905 [Proteobacteria bacterium SG_bin5]|nr:MAG: hypothetical protein A4S12_13905 [Proteobacteria bacterium SG_bin5]
MRRPEFLLATYVTLVAIILDGVLSLATTILTPATPSDGDFGWMMSLLLGNLCCAVVAAAWLIRAGQIARADSADHLIYSPWGRVLWFFVPIFCLFKPFQGMRELWNVAHGNAAHSDSQWVVNSWWGATLASGTLGLFFSLVNGINNPLPLALTIVLGLVGVTQSGLSLWISWAIGSRLAKGIGDRQLAQVFA